MNSRGKDLYHPNHAALKAQVERLVGGRLGQTCLEPHSHQCPSCGLIWAHDPWQIANMPERVFDKSHECPNCHIEQIRVYRGGNTPTCVNTGLQCTFLTDKEVHNG